MLYEIYRGGRRVVACSARAGSLGVAPGMSLSEATALAEASTTSLLVEPADPTADRQKLEKLAQACQQFSPVVGLEEGETPESLLLDITGLAHLFHGEQRLAEEVLGSLTRRGLSARIGVADTVGAAWAVAHFGDCGLGGVMLKHNLPTQDALLDKPAVAPSIILPPQETLAALRLMPVEALRLPGKTVELLHQLGISRIGQLAALPRAELAGRFGPQLLGRWDQALGQIAEPIWGQPFPSEFQAEQLLEQPTSRRETIEFLVQQLIGRVAEMLFRSGRGATQLECCLHCGTTDVELSVGLFQPTDSPQHLFQLVQMRLERLSLPAAVAAVSVRAVTTAVVVRRQQELFCDGRDVERPRFLAALIDRLSSRLGRRAVLRPRLICDAQPELAYHYDPLVEDQGGQRTRRRGNAADVMLVRRGSPDTASPQVRRTSPDPASPQVRRGSPDPAETADRQVSSGHGRPSVASGGSVRRPATTVETRSGDRPQQLGELPLRPLRLVGRPVSLAVVSILPDGTPVQFQWQGHECRITKRWGPERIQTGWWRGQAIGRDYYRIETAAGRRFWLFRRLRDGRWFMHGMFE